MSVEIEHLDLDSLTIPERLELIGILWDSITDSGEVVTPDWHLQQLASRRAAAEANPDAGVSWEEVKARLLDRL